MLGDDEGLGSHCRRTLRQLLPYVGMKLPDDGGLSALEDARLLHRDRLERVPEVFPVVPTDRRDARAHRVDNVRGVETATEARLNQRDINLRLRKDVERKRGGRLEEG